MTENKHQPNDIFYCNICYGSLTSNGVICERCSQSNLTSSVTLPYFLQRFESQNQKKIMEIPMLYREREACFSKIHFTGPINHLLNNMVHSKKFDTALHSYKTLFGEIYTNPLLLSSMFYDDVLEYKTIESAIGILIHSIIPNAFSLTHQHILTQIICDVIRYEFHHTYDMTTFLRENSPATKLFSAYLNREPIRQFIDQLVEDACRPCLDDYKENVDIDPNHIEDGDVAKTIEERKEKLIKYIDFILSKILNTEPYPISLRIICKKLSDLAASKRRQSRMRLRNAFIGGFIFLRIFNAKIACYGFVASTKPPYREYAQNVRRKFTLLSKILQNIANQIESGMKEEWMGVLDPYIFSKFEAIHQFIAEMCDIPALKAYYVLNDKMLHDARQNESVYISMDDLMVLTTGISDDYHKRSKTGQVIVDHTNKRFYGAISDIMKRKAFLHECQKKYTAHFVQIMVGKHEIAVDKASSQRAKLEKELNNKVIPILCKVSDLKDVAQNYTATEHLMADLIGLLQQVQSSKTKIKKRHLKKALNVLKQSEKAEMIEEVLMKLYTECVMNIDVFNRLNQETREMTLYINGGMEHSKSKSKRSRKRT